MLSKLQELGKLIKAQREQKNLTQEQLANACGNSTNRTAVAHLEQGIRVPRADALENICTRLAVPKSYWGPFARPESVERFRFEEVLSEMAGQTVDLDNLEEDELVSAEGQLNLLLHKVHSAEQTYDILNSVLIYYGTKPLSHEFFERYLGPEAFTSIDNLINRVEAYIKDAIRLFSSIAEAFNAFNIPNNVKALTLQLDTRQVREYSDRTDWDTIEEIPNERLPDLGFISASRIRKEKGERATLKKFLLDLAKGIRKKGPAHVDSIQEKTKRRMDSLLRKFHSRLQHGLSSTLFVPDADMLEREATAIAPIGDEEIARMAETQATAQRNMARYLSADHMDVYVATSMRSDADFVSVNTFSKDLFNNNKLTALKLRYFNPTQSWIEDRIAKGLIEALMLKRATMTIYMAQKEDTFGKDSEASVALGQGKPVIVYVPKLVVPNSEVDSEAWFQRNRGALVEYLHATLRQDISDIDDSVDLEAIVGRVLSALLEKVDEKDLVTCVAGLWADFDLYGEAERIPNDEIRAVYRKWLDEVRGGDCDRISPTLRPHLEGILVATAIRFESRATVFREVHPLALQVILSSGVLNGILVVRSCEQCAEVMLAVLKNELKLSLVKDEMNYRLVEEITQSTLRVISRHQLIRNAFETFYPVTLLSD